MSKFNNSVFGKYSPPLWSFKEPKQMTREELLEKRESLMKSINEFNRIINAI